jgi:hypothetical protein
MPIDVKGVVLVMAMLCVTIITSVAMLSGVDGAALTGGTAAVVTIAGYLFISSRKAESPKEEAKDKELIEE